MKTIKSDEPIDVYLFANDWKVELQNMPFEAFVNNMVHLKIEKKTYAEWIKTWLAWNELSTDEDIDMMYAAKDMLLEIEE